MRVLRDKFGHICQINMDDGSEIPSNEIKTAFDFISNDEKEITARIIAKEITARIIAKEKEITAREKNRCDFWKDSIKNIANSITCTTINQIENDCKTLSIQKIKSRITSTKQVKENIRDEGRMLDDFLEKIAKFQENPELLDKEDLNKEIFLFHKKEEPTSPYDD